MDSKKDKVSLSDDQLDQVSGGFECNNDGSIEQITSEERVPDGVCPTCGGPAYRVTQRGKLGDLFEFEKTWRECPAHGWISV